MNNWTSGIKYIGGSESAESEAIHGLAELVSKQVGEIGQASQRPQHAKPLAATTQAQFVVAGDLAPDLRVGFLVPGNTYATTLRFSNAGAMVLADREKDLRGLAFRVDVPGRPPHDFLMTNAERHHAKTAVEAMWTSYLMYKPGAKNKIDGILRLVGKFGPVTALRIISTLSAQIKRPVRSLAMESFWSRSPYRFGSVAVRFVVRPMTVAEEATQACGDLGQELSDRVQKAAVVYKLEVQRYIDEVQTPLEDSTRPWTSPFEHIGSLVIEQGTDLVDFKATERLGFNPWNVSSTDFEPLGNMNRARSHVYQASYTARST